MLIEAGFKLVSSRIFCVTLPVAFLSLLSVRRRMELMLKVPSPLSHPGRDQSRLCYSHVKDFKVSRFKVGILAKSCTREPKTGSGT